MLLGFDIGGTKAAAVLGDETGAVLARREVPTGPPGATIARLIELAGAIAGDRLARGEVRGCGISCGGPLSSREGSVLSPPNLPGWDRVPIVRLVREALGVPTALENDANAAAVAEWEWGLNRRVDNLVYLTCGTGQGAGLVLDGRLYRGREDLAGEIGHVRLTPAGPVGYHKAGSVEGWTSGTGLANLARSRLADPHAPGALDAQPPEQITGKTVGDAALAGDVFAIGLVKELADHLGATCAMLIDLLNPQRISLGSMAHRLGPLLLDGVRAAAKREALPAAFAACAIEPAALGPGVQDLAALAAALSACETG